MKPYHSTPYGNLYLGDVNECLGSFSEGSIHCCVTSPPYWGQRDYGVEAQMGREEHPFTYIKKVSEAFKGVNSVLSADGTLWLNLGDTYSAGGLGHGSGKQTTNYGSCNGEHIEKARKAPDGFKRKELIGVPWRVAIVLQESGWYLRQDIIWHKPNPMPESVNDRCTKAHEYIFLLSKSEKYYYNADAIREPYAKDTIARSKRNSLPNLERAKAYPGQPSFRDRGEGTIRLSEGLKGRNKRSVWTVTTKSFKGAHFATFPPDLIAPCILAGCPFGGIVLDPFMGSGTTAIVAMQHGRRYVGIELNKKYLDEIAIPRIEKEIQENPLL